MKKILPTLGCFLLVTLLGTQLALPQNAPTGKFFVRMNMGAAVAQDVEVKEFLTDLRVVGKDMEFNPGFSMHVNGGYQFTDFFAAELETGYTINRIDQVDGAPQVFFNDSSISTVPLMVNATFQIPTRSPFIPYAGAGLGGSLNVLYADNITGYEGPWTGYVVDGSDSEMVFGYQFFAGLRYQINPQMEVNVGYKYYATKETAWDVDTIFYPGVDGIGIDGMSIHSATLSFLFRF